VNRAAEALGRIGGSEVRGVRIAKTGLSRGRWYKLSWLRGLGNFHCLDRGAMAASEVRLKIVRFAARLVLIGALFGIAGCSHKLVGRGGETTVSVFPSKKDFDNVMSMKSRGGAEGMVGGLGETFIAKKVAENTPVKVFSSDSEGDEIQVLEGPNAGLRGYVAKDNVD
jgi:hypothetical protein